MKAAGFHWFVAWRYLMARPRRVSPAIVAVAGVLFIVSIAASLVGGIILRSQQADPFVPHAAYDSALIGAVVLLTVGALTLLLGLVRYCRADPGRIWVPCAIGVGLLLSATGAVAHGAEDARTHTAALLFLAAGGPLVGLGVLGYWRRARGYAAASLAVAGLLSAAGVAAYAIARGALVPAPGLTTHPADALLLPALALWVAGVVSAVLVLAHGRIRGRVSRAGAGMTLLLLMAAALYPHGARWLLDAPALVQYLPTGAPHAALVQWGGLGLAGLGILLLGVVALQRRAARGRAAVFLTGVALLTAGGLCALVARFLLIMPDRIDAMLPVGGLPHHQVLLAAVALLALGELAVVLGAVRYFFTFFTSVSMAGVAIGAMALVIVLSVMSGFESDLRDKILGSNAHVLITKEEGSFTEYRQVAARIEDLPGVVAHTPYLVSEVVIAANNSYANVIIKGVDPETIGDVTELDENLEQPRALERLYPLVDDGDTAEPSGTGAAPGDDGGDGDAGGTGAAGPGAWDPPPADMNVDIDEPLDLSGLSGQSDQSGGALPDAAGAGEGASEQADPGAWDPPPADMNVDIDEPLDLSGQSDQSGLGGGQASGGADGMDTAGPIFDLPGELPGKLPEELAGDLDGAEPPSGPDVAPSGPDVAPSGDGWGQPGSWEERIPARVARLPGVLVGKELVKNIHLYVGQEVRIVSPLGEDTPAGPVPRTRFMRVAGTFFTGMYEYDLKFVYVPLQILQSFLDLGDEVSGIEISIVDPEQTGPVLEAIRGALPAGYRVQDWKQINRSLFSALKLEKIAMFLVLAIIILVASFSIVGNLVMVVVEKAKEIALIKTLGATDGGVVKIFVAQGFFIGLVGTTIGVTHGLLACLLGAIYGLPLDPAVYYIDQLPIHIEPTAVGIIAVAGVMISVIATLYPATVGARLQPLEGLRYD